MISKQAQVDQNIVAYGALLGKHRNFYDLAILKGANDWELIALGASESGNVKVLKFALGNYPNPANTIDLSHIALEIAESEEILTIIHEYDSAREEQLKLVDRLVKYIYKNIEAKYGNMVMLIMLIEEWYLEEYEGEL